MEALAKLELLELLELEDPECKVRYLKRSYLCNLYDGQLRTNCINYSGTK